MTSETRRLADELLEIALDAATAVARQLHGRRAFGFEFEEKSSSVDVVTDVDRWAENAIVAAIAARRPDDAVLAEEGGSRPGTSEVDWMVDPIDGTTNFVYGHPGYAVSIGASVEGEPTVGVVADGSVDDTFWAVRGGGAFHNGRRVRVGEAPPLATALVATGFSYDASIRAEQARWLQTVLPRVRDIRRMGSAALDLCSVAAGRVDGYYELVLSPWDIAAGRLVAAEAGAVVTAIDGSEPGPSVLAAPPRLHSSLLELLAQARSRA